MFDFIFLLLSIYIFFFFLIILDIVYNIVMIFFYMIRRVRILSILLCFDNRELHLVELGGWHS